LGTFKKLKSTTLSIRRWDKLEGQANSIIATFSYNIEAMEKLVGKHQKRDSEGILKVRVWITTVTTLKDIYVQLGVLGMGRLLYLKCD